MLEQSPKPEPRSRWVRSAFEKKQPRRLSLALILLVAALAVVVVKDREFWFGPDESAEAEAAATEPVSATATTPSAVPNAASQATPAPAASATPAKKQIAAKPATAKSPEPAVANAGVITTKRTVLPPLAVEVVTGDMHRTLRPGSNAIKVEIPRSSGPTTNAADLERMSPGIAIQPDSYPLLAQRARVEGSVVLQALIGADGTIQDLRVLSGPAILAPAAQQAVRQWRFKPYLQNGLPVETKANITVSFTIKVSDAAKTT